MCITHLALAGNETMCITASTTCAAFSGSNHKQFCPNKLGRAQTNFTPTVQLCTKQSKLSACLWVTLEHTGYQLPASKYETMLPKGHLLRLGAMVVMVQILLNHERSVANAKEAECSCHTCTLCSASLSNALVDCDVQRSWTSCPGQVPSSYHGQSYTPLSEH